MKTDTAIIHICHAWFAILLGLIGLTLLSIKSDLNSMKNVYDTVESFNQEVKATQNSLIILDATLAKVTNNAGTAKKLLVEFIELTRTESNQIAKLIRLNEEATK